MSEKKMESAVPSSSLEAQEYTAPKIEKHLTREEIEREVHYAGFFSGGGPG